MSAHLWRKASVLVLAGAAVYGGFLYTLTIQDQKSNQLKQAEQEKAAKKQMALEQTFQDKKKTLLALEQKLAAEQVNTSKTDAQLKAVKEEITQLKAGKLPNSVKLPTVSTPQASQPTQQVTIVQPPAVQTTTKASGT